MKRMNGLIRKSNIRGNIVNQNLIKKHSYPPCEVNLSNEHQMSIHFFNLRFFILIDR